MKYLVQLLVLLAAPLAAHADAVPPDVIALPEPETLSLLAIGGLALLLSARRNK